MAKISVFTFDSRLDRRVVLECDSLIEHGHDVTLFAAPYEDSGSDPAYVRRINEIHSATKATKSLYVRLLGYRRWLGQRFPATTHFILPIARAVFFRTYNMLATVRTSCKKELQWSRSQPELMVFETFHHVLVPEIASDLYIAHDLPMIPTALEAKRLYGGKVIFDSHELFPDQEFTKFEQRMWRNFETRIIGDVDRVITINPSIASIIKERHHLPHVDYIYNADLLPVGDLKRSRKLQEVLALPDSARVLLYQGGMSFERNLDALVRMMTHIHDPSIHLVFLGSGPARDGIKKLSVSLLLQDRVHFLDAVTQAELLSYTASADIGVIPYQDICLNNRYCTPNKLFEFICAGIPMVATDLIEIARIFKEHGIGLTGDTANPAALAAMVNLAMEETTFLRLRHNVEVARQTINWQREGGRFVQIVENTLGLGTDSGTTSDLKMKSSVN